MTNRKSLQELLLKKNQNNVLVLPLGKVKNHFAQGITKLITFIFFLILLGAFGLANAATITTTGSGNWSSTTNNAPWPGGILPLATDNVIIGAGFTLTVDGNRTCVNITVGNASTLTVNGSVTLTVTNILAFPNLAGVSSTGALSGAGSITAASVTVAGTIAPTTNHTIVITSSIGSLTTTGNFTLTGQYAAGGGGRVSNPTFNLASGTITVGGTLMSVTAANSAVNTTFSMQTGAQSGTLNLNGATPISTSGNAGIPTFSFNGTTATVGYERAGVQTVHNANPAPQVYRNLTLAGSGAKTCAAFTVNGTLSMQGTATAITTSPIYGASGILEYRGGAAQTATAIEWPATSGPVSLIVNNASGVSMTAGLNRTLTTNLTLTAGTLNIATNILTYSGTNLTRTTGNINAGGVGATMNFTNTAALTLPSSCFTGNITNWTNGGAGSVTFGSATTVTGVLTLTAGSLVLGPNSFDFSGTSLTRVSGTINASNTSSTITFGSNITHPAGLFTGDVNNLTINAGAGTVTLGANINILNTLSITSGTLSTSASNYSMTVNGVLSIAGTFVANGSTINVKSNWFNSGTFTAGTSTVVINGTSSQLINGTSGTIFRNLTMNNSTGLQILNAFDITIGNGTSGVLTLAAGNITNASSKVVLAANSTTAYTSGHITGQMQMNFGTGANITRTFHIGTSTAYRRTTVNFASVTGAGNLILRSVNGEHGSLCTGTPIDTARSVNAYWTMTNVGITFSTYTITMLFAPADRDAGTVTSSFVVRRFNAGAWTAPTSIVATSDSTSGVGFSTIGTDFAIGHAFVAPAITTQPIATSVCSGSSASFTVVATGVGLTYRWRKNGVNLSNGGNISGALTATLTINPATISDTSSFYSVVVTGSCANSVTSSNAALTIGATTITTQPVSVNVCFGANTFFSVVASGSGLTYQWKKNNVNLSNGGHISGATSATLTISGADMSDTSSSYKVTVTGSCGAVTSGNVALVVLFPPSIFVQPVNQMVLNGTQAKFYVSAGGTGLTYQWKRNATNLVNGGNISGATSDTLFINPATMADTSENYSVVVSGTCPSPQNSVLRYLRIVNPFYFVPATGNWNVAANWSTGAIPTSLDSAVIGIGQICTIPAGYAAVSKSTTVIGELIMLSGSSLTGSGTLNTKTTATLSTAGAFPNFISDSLNGHTIYNGVNQTVRGTYYRALTINNTGIASLGGSSKVLDDFTIAAGGHFVHVEDTNELHMYTGDFINNGTYDPSESKVTFYGSTVDQFITGTSESDFWNLSIKNNSGSAVQLVKNSTLSNLMELAPGSIFTVVSPNIYTFRSWSIDSTAQLLFMPNTSDFNGVITMQRYIDYDGWHELLPAVDGSNFVGVRYWEPYPGIMHRGYVPDDYNPIPELVPDGNLEGAWDSTNVSYIYSGTPHIGGKTFNLSWTATAYGAWEDGWNMVGNPYPASVNWDILAGWTKTDIDPVWWVWEPKTQDYRYWETGFGGTSQPMITSTQGFWVHALSASAVFEINELAKDPLNNIAAVFHKTGNIGLIDNSDHITLRITDNTNSLNFDDRCFIRFAANADSLKEIKDPVRLYSATSKAPNIASLTADPVPFVVGINHYPELNQNFTIPVQIKIINLGNHTIDWPGLTSSMPSGSCITLEDLFTGDIIDMRAQSSYTFYGVPTLLSGNQINVVRFKIHFAPPAQTNLVLAGCPGTPNGAATVQGNGTGPWTYVWKDASGNVIQTASGVNGSNTLNNYPAGLYTVSITNSGGTYCTSIEQEIEILGLPQVFTNEVVTHVTCNQSTDGAININPIGPGPFTYLWSNGATSEDISGIAAGSYVVSITDSNSCVQDIAINVGYINQVISTFIPDNNTLYMGASGAVTFNNASSGAANYTWDFGDGSAPYITNSNAPIVWFYDVSAPTTYNVTLLSKNGTCEDISTLQIEVVDGTIVQNLLDEETNKIYAADGKIMVTLSDPSNAKITVYNALGMKIFSDKTDKQNTTIDMSDEATGVYLVKIETKDKKLSRKVSIHK